MSLHGILEAALYTDDLDAAEQFYAKVLHLPVIARQPGRHVFFRCDDSVLLIFDARTTLVDPIHASGPSVPLHGATGAGHVAFRVRDADLAGWREQLRQAGVTIEKEIPWPQGGHSIYFRDPAGNSLELATPALWKMPER